MVGQSGSMLAQGCPENYFPEPHTQSCVHCHHLCHPIYDTPLECEKFCPDYMSPLASLRQDVQTTALLDIKQTFDTKIFTCGAILLIGVMFVLVNMIHAVMTRRILKLYDKREMEKLYPKYFGYQHKYHTLHGTGKFTVSNIQNNASKEKNVRSNRGSYEEGSLPKFNLVNDKNIPHEQTVMVHHQQSSIFHSNVERNNNIQTQADNVSTAHEVAMSHIHDIDQSPGTKPWFFFRAHKNEIPMPITSQFSPANTASDINTQGLANERTYPILHKSYPEETFEPMSNHKDQGDLQKYIYQNDGESTYVLSLSNVNSSWRPLHPDMESFDKNSGDEELSHLLPQDTLPKIRLQDQSEDEELPYLLPQDIQPNDQIQDKSDSSGYGTQDTDNSSASGVTTLQCVGVSSALNDVGSFRSDVNESLQSDPEYRTHSTMLPNDPTEIYLRSDSGDGVSHGKIYTDDAGSETWGKVRLLYEKIKDLMPKYPWILNCAVCNEYVEVDLDGRSVTADIAMKRITDNIDKDLLNYLHFSSGDVSQISLH